MTVSVEGLSVAPSAPLSKAVVEAFDGARRHMPQCCAGLSGGAPAALPEDPQCGSGGQPGGGGRRVAPRRRGGALQIIAKAPEEWHWLAECFEDNDLLGCGSRVGPCQRACINNMRRSVFREGSILLQAGADDPPPQLFIIVSGYCEVLSSDGERWEVLGPGMHFGEAALTQGTPPARTVCVLPPEPLVAFHLDRPAWRRVSAQHRPTAPPPSRLLCDGRQALPFLTPKELADLMPALKRTVFLKGDVVWEHGQEAGALLFVVDGALDLLLPPRLGAEAAGRCRSVRCPTGHCVGELELLTGGAAAATVQAAEDTLCLALAPGDAGALPPLLLRVFSEALAVCGGDDFYANRCVQYPGCSVNLTTYKFGCAVEDKSDSLETTEVKPSASGLTRRRYAVWDDQPHDVALPEREAVPSGSPSAVLQHHLSTHPLFRHLDGADRRWLATQMEERWYSAGAAISGPCSGDDGDAFFVVMQGMCGLFPGNGAVDVVDQYGSFGGHHLLLPGPSEPVARALTAVRALRLGRAAYRRGVRAAAERRAAEFAALWAAVPFVRPMAPADCAALQDRATVQRWLPGDWVLRDGGAAGCVVLLAEGEVHYRGPDGQGVRRPAGPVTGWDVLLGPRSAVDLVVLQSTRTWTVTLADLQDVLGDGESWLAEDVLARRAARPGSPPPAWRRHRGKSPGRRARSPWPARPLLPSKKKVAQRVRRRSPYPAASLRRWCPPPTAAGPRPTARGSRPPSPLPALQPRRPHREQLLCPVVPALRGHGLPLTRPVRVPRCPPPPESPPIASQLSPTSQPLPTQQWLRETFQEQSLFGLGDPDTPVMEALIAGMAEVTLVCGQQITRGGATVGPDDVMHLIVQGQCAVMIDGETVATLGAGECIGELEFMHRWPIKCTAVVVSPSLTAFALRRSAYTSVVDKQRGHVSGACV